MKKLMMFSLLILAINLFAQNGPKADAEEQFLVAEKKMKDVYKKILNEYKRDSVFVKHLKKSQQLWLRFRDAQMEMKYPDTINGRYSAQYFQCVFSYKRKLTAERITTIEEWLGEASNEECTGTLRARRKVK